jgi:sigma-E factor negative regulatory protein RseC
MSKNETIEHIGVISEIRSNLILVDLSVQSACAACHAKGVCGEGEQKTIEVRTDKNFFNVGEKVNVIMRQSLGMKALFLGYLMPFIVVVSTLFTLMMLGVSEGISGLLSIVLLGPYYYVLYLLKDKIKREFNFDIEKI